MKGKIKRNSIGARNYKIHGSNSLSNSTDRIKLINRYQKINSKVCFS